MTKPVRLVFFVLLAVPLALAYDYFFLSVMVDAIRAVATDTPTRLLLRFIVGWIVSATLLLSLSIALGLWKGEYRVAYGLVVSALCAVLPWAAWRAGLVWACVTTKLCL